MSHIKLKNYIIEAQKSGLSNQRIVEELIKAGWKIDDLIDIAAGSYGEDSGPIISVENVSKYFQNVKALEGVNMEMRKGEISALLGPNGAGKTTLVRIMATLLQPSSGQVEIAGLDVVRDAQKLRSVIGLAGQYAAVDEVLTGRENLEMFGRLYHLSNKDAQNRAVELFRQFDLEDAADRPVKTYSGGMRRRLDLASSLIVRPRVLFLDEPTTGLDPRSRFVLWGVIRDLAAAGTTILLTTQYLEEADQLADNIFLMDHGYIITQGTADELKRQVGGDVLELHMVNHAEAKKAGEILGQMARGTPYSDTNTGIVTMPTDAGAGIIVDAVRQMDSAGLKLQDITLRRPSLDDVFMKLTGHGAN